MGTKSHIRLIFYGSWLLLAILQSSFTHLSGDEAYYWMYSRQLTWGYFDHPPMIAFFIKAGYSLLPNELGMRLMSILSIMLSFYILEKISQPKKPLLFYLLVSSLGILHFIGFLAIPDAPLFLFTALFLLLYKAFLKDPRFSTILLLGLSIALLLLSKYHGILLIFFSILANPKLLYKKHFYYLFLIALLYFLPHILWQYQNDFPSIRYHLIERSQKAYTFTFTSDYILSQILVLGPVTLVLFILGALQAKNHETFPRTLKWIFWGGLGFFLLMSFKGSVEAHWTVFTLVPGILLAYPYVEKNLMAEKILRISFLPTLFIILFLRCIIAIESPWSFGELVDQFHREKEKIEVVADKANGHPVAFMNSYQEASLYNFYVHQNAFSLNNIMGRKNQYDIWQSMEKYRGDSVLLIPNYHVDFLPKLKAKTQEIQFQWLANFQAYPYVKFKAIDAPDRIKRKSNTKQRIQIIYPNKKPITFKQSPDFPSFITYQWFRKDSLISDKNTLALEKVKQRDSVTLSISSPPTAGKYFLRFSVRTGWLPPTINSDSYPILVE